LKKVIIYQHLFISFFSEEKKTERMNSVNSIVPSSQYDSDINNL